MIRTIFALMLIVFVGCDRDIKHRMKEIKTYEGKTISEAYLIDNSTAVLRFTDGTMVTFDSVNHDGNPILVNMEKD